MEYDRQNNYFFGELYFRLEYQGVQIADVYPIRAFLNHLDANTRLPKVICESNKIRDIAQKYEVDSCDLHINTDGSFCLAIEGEEESFFENKFTIQEFFTNAVEGFLFQISYFNKHGSFPWGEYAHGYLGHIEKFASGTITIGDLFRRLSKEELAKVLLSNRQSRCLCGKGKKMRHCHPLVFRGISKIKIEILSWKYI